jgi:DNA replication and repair protein RecF
MYLRSLYLLNFRNYEEAYFEFGPHLNLICGANAQGKTSVLEAIHYLMQGRSFRFHQGSDLIKQGAASFYIEAKFSKHGVEQSLKIGFDGKERRIIYNHTALVSIPSLIGIIPGVTMAPDDINLIKGAPQLRRQFLDLQIAQIDPLYVHHLTRYSRATRQRNQLLKAKQLLTIESWEHEMGQSAAYLVMQRQKSIEHLQRHCQEAYCALTAEQEPIAVAYKTALPLSYSASELRQYQVSQLQKHRTREMILGYTLTGPHKDDVGFLIDAKETRHFASEGQQRSYMTAIRLAEWRSLNQLGHDSPLFLIDDVGISLDQERRQKLLNQMTQMGQVFLTATDKSLLDHISMPKKIFHIQKAQIVCETEAKN